MDRPTSIIVSLSDAAGIVKQGMREYTARMIERKSPRLSLLKDTLDHDCTAYLNQVLTEIFADQGMPEVVGGTSHSTRMLMDCGLERDYAVAIAMQVARTVLSQLTAFFPTLVLGPNCQYQYEMCSEFDVFVTPPLEE